MSVMITCILGCACWVATAQTRIHAAAGAFSYANQRPYITIASKDPLALGEPTSVPDSVQKSAFPYRYHGLRLLLYSSGTYFVIPDGGWTNGMPPSVSIIPATPRIQVTLDDVYPL
jgi:hypothetical protein